VRKSPTTTQNVVTYETIITVENPGQKLFPGMTAEVSILVAHHKKVMIIPNTALRYTPPVSATFEKKPPTQVLRTQRLVYSLSPDGIQLRPILVKTSITDGVHTEITEGLAEDAAVVTSTLVTAEKSKGFLPPQPPPQS
jgi:HlyD family secretion protein